MKNLTFTFMLLKLSVDLCFGVDARGLQKHCLTRNFHLAMIFSRKKVRLCFDETNFHSDLLFVICKQFFFVTIFFWKFYVLDCFRTIALDLEQLFLVEFNFKVKEKFQKINMCAQILNKSHLNVKWLWTLLY